MKCPNRNRATLTAVATLIVGLFSERPIHAADLIPPKAYTVTPGGINLADGSYAYTVTDLSIGAMELVRFYRSGGTSQANDPPFGKNFSSNFDIYVATNPVGATKYPIVHVGAGASGTYIQTGSSINPNNKDAERGILSWNGTQYVYTDSTGSVYTFSATVQAVGMPFATQSRKIERIDYPNGRRQTFSYNATGYLKLVDDTFGYAMVFDYDANGDVTAACGFNRGQDYVSVTSTCSGALLKTTYTYTSLYLTTVTNALGQVTTYTNASAGLTCIKPPGYATCVVSLSSSLSSTVQTLQDGGTWTVTHDNPNVVNNPDASPGGDGTNEVAVTDANNVTTYLNFTKTSPYTMTDANNHVTQYRYEGGVPYNNPFPEGTTYGSFLVQTIFHEGNKYLAEYVGPFRSITKETFLPKPGSGLGNLEMTYGYGSCAGPIGSYQNCAKPIWVKDFNGKQTDYTYATHGGVLSEMPAAPAVGAPRPLTLFSYIQKYAYVKNSSGALVTAATPVWMLSTSTQCQTIAGGSSPACDASATQTVTTNEFGANGTANNLRVRGAAVSWNGTTLRTCFGYDNQGNKISQTSARAGLGSCP